jgi:hypothetical protein
MRIRRIRLRALMTAVGTSGVLLGVFLRYPETMTAVALFGTVYLTLFIYLVWYAARW